MKTSELITACKMVVAAHPEIDHLFITVSGRWLFCDDSFNAPSFGEEIDVGALEDMINSLDTEYSEYPIGFYIPEVLA